MFFLALAGAPWLYVNKHMCDMWNDDRHQEPNGHKIEFDPESNWEIFDSFLFRVILFINLWSFANLQMLQWCMLSIMSPDLWCQWQATNDVCFKPKTTLNSVFWKSLVKSHFTSLRVLEILRLWYFAFNLELEWWWKSTKSWKCQAKIFGSSLQVASLG